MTREIKFRAWSKAERMFLEIDSYGNFKWGPDRLAISAVGHENGTDMVLTYDDDSSEKGKYGSVYFGDKMVLQQFTGLKDKNGTEIYEGDIVQYKKGYPFVVEFRQGAFRPSYASHFGRFPRTDRVIIGNIYENPELVK